LAEAAVSGNPSPLCAHRPDQPVAWRKGVAITRAEFLLDVARIAARLPQRDYVFNLCEDRYRFMVGFAAAMQRRQISLMPPNSTAGAVNDLLPHYPDSYCLSDRRVADIATLQVGFNALYEQADEPAEAEPIVIEPERQSAILFTSGSTGKPRMHSKTWGNLQFEAVQALSHFPFRTLGARSLLATVPSQHMYGLAASVLIPWQGALGIEAARPLFPADICQALAQLPAPRVLITTPLHLRACISAGLNWPDIAFAISATAPLPSALAAEAESHLQTQIFEIYGSTETGSVAGRRTVDETAWRLYAGMSIHAHDSGCRIEGGHLCEPVLLNDRVSLDSPHRFRLLGRDSDMVKIAGKRASLGDLTHQLMRIPGVIDGIFLPPGDHTAEQRLCALVVAPTLNRQQILEALSRSIDAVFLPRPLHMVEALPRNATGKVPKASLQALLKSLRKLSC
jgi:acyl-coenzyme A synthetase/AMP-(fatty) acid ligase